MNVLASGAWARLLNASLGIWLMASPAVIGYAAPASTNDRLVGPVAASFAVIALWEVTRPLRNVNTAIGIWLALVPFFLGYPIDAAANSILVGLLMSSLSRVRGEVGESFGGGWKILWKARNG